MFQLLGANSAVNKSKLSTCHRVVIQRHHAKYLHDYNIIFSISNDQSAYDVTTSLMALANRLDQLVTTYAGGESRRRFSYINTSSES